MTLLERAGAPANNDGDEMADTPNPKRRSSVAASELQVIESCNSTWIFDPGRMRFRRVPKGTPIDLPAAAAEWEPYYDLELDMQSDAFLVTLNESGTRLLRSFRHTDPCRQCQPNATTELSLEAIREGLGSSA